MEKRILFVCLGNICRSPAAEGVMKHMLQKRGLSESYFVDSAGTSAFHEGSSADPRMQEFAAQRGYSLESVARQFRPEIDFSQFDWIVPMDGSNHRFVRTSDPSGQNADKIIPFTNKCIIHEISEVPDPYYGGDAGFEYVMDIVEDGCKGWIDFLENKSS